MFNNFHKNKYNLGFTTPERGAGFTLVELLVVISIFMITTGIMIFNYGKFNSSISIQNLADDIALTVRRAQGYAIGVRSFDATSSFDQGYGIHFSTIPNPNDLEGSNKAFILFVDRGGTTSGNKMYNYNNGSICGNMADSTNECVEVLNILSADKIDSITVNDDTTPKDTVDIFFKRPNPEPTFCPDGACDLSITSITIGLSSEKSTDIVKYITISNTGQISVSN